jgi:hypothetical protein
MTKKNSSCFGKLIAIDTTCRSAEQLLLRRCHGQGQEEKQREVGDLLRYT